MTVDALGASRLSRARKTLVALARGLDQHGALDSARLMAFNFFLSLVPLLVLIGFAMGHFVRKRGVDALMGPILDAVPPAAGDLVRHELERMAGARVSSIAPVSVAIFLWLTSSGTHNLMDVFEVAAHATPRRWWKQRAIAVLAVGLALGSVSLTAWGLWAADESLHRREASEVAVPSAPTASVPAASPSSSAASRASKPPHDGHAPSRQTRKPALTRTHERWERLIAGIVMMAVGFAGLAVFYRYAVEHPAGIHRRALPGAATAVVSWLIVSWAFGAYVISLGTYAVYYGSLAAVAVLLVWLYLSSLALLLGAEVNAYLEGVGAHE